MTGRLFTERPNVNGVDVALVSELSGLAIVSENINGILKDYNPPGGIDNCATIEINPAAKTWSAGDSTIPCPQGYIYAVPPLLDSPGDWLWTSRGINQDTGFWGTRKSSSGGKYFSSTQKRLGVSSGSAPTYPTFPTVTVLDGSVIWHTLVDYFNLSYDSTGWHSNTTITQGTAIIISGDVWIASFVFSDAKTGGSAPSWASTEYGQSLQDNHVFWVRYGIYKGPWSATTTYGLHTTTGHLYIYPDFVSIASNTKLLCFRGGHGTFATTSGAEPAWSSAAPFTMWEDNEVMWTRGSEFLGAQFVDAGAERTVITSLQAPTGDGAIREIVNTGINEQAVILADKLKINDGIGNHSDVYPSSAPGFDFGGYDIVLQSGERALLVYNATAGTWSGVKNPTIPNNGSALDYLLLGYSQSDTNPGAGMIGFSAGGWNIGQTLYISKYDRYNSDLTNILSAFDDSTSTLKGYLRVYKADDPTKWVLYSITSLTVATDYIKLVVAIVAYNSAVPPFSPSSSIYPGGYSQLRLEFSRTGDKGDTGSTGATGQFGGNSFAFTFDNVNTSDADPGNGKVRFNNTTMASVTFIYLDELDANAINVSTWPSSFITNGIIKIYDLDNPTHWILFQQSGSISHPSGYVKIPVTYLSSNSSLQTGAGKSVLTYGQPGATGATGSQGFQGLQGNPGYGNQFNFTFDTSITDADPGNGKLRFNNATYSSVTQIYIDLLEASNNTDITGWLDSFDDAGGSVVGFLRIQQADNAAVWAVYKITTVTTASGYRKLNVTYISSAGSFSTGTANTIVAFAPSGYQTDITGNAGTATKLATARNLDNQSFDGSTNITIIAPGTHAATAKTTPVDADELPLVDSAASNVLKKLSWASIKATLKTYFDTLYPSGSGTSTGTNTGDQTAVSGNAGTATKLVTARNLDGQAFDGSADITIIAPGTHAATDKTTPVDADELSLVDSAASNILKKLSWANLKATLKTYFDTLYLTSSQTWTVLKQVADQTVTNQATLQNSNTFTIPMVSGKTYAIRGVIFAETTATGDFKYGFATPTVTRVRANIRANAAGATVQAEAAIATALTASTALTATVGSGIYIDFYITFTAGSTASFIFQFAQNTQTNDAGVQVLKGSFVEYIQVD